MYGPFINDFYGWNNVKVARKLGTVLLEQLTTALTSKTDTMYEPVILM